MSQEEIKFENAVRTMLEIVDENQESEQEIQPENQTAPVSDEDTEEEVYECPECGAPITIDMTVCPNCGVGLSFEYEDEE